MINQYVVSDSVAFHPSCAVDLRLVFQGLALKRLRFVVYEFTALGEVMKEFP